MALGYLSILDASTQCPAGHTFDKPVNGYCVAYGRDRRDTGVQARKLNNVTIAKWKRDHKNTEFHYKWEDGKWWVFVYNYDPGSTDAAEEKFADMVRRLDPVLTEEKLADALENGFHEYNDVLVCIQWNRIEKKTEEMKNETVKLRGKEYEVPVDLAEKIIEQAEAAKTVEDEAREKLDEAMDGCEVELRKGEVFYKKDGAYAFRYDVENKILYVNEALWKLFEDEMELSYGEVKKLSLDWARRDAGLNAKEAVYNW